MLKKSNKVLSFILSAVLVISGIACVPGSVEAEGNSGDSSDYGLSNPKIAYNYRETVTFGNYWQEDTNGDLVANENDDKQPIVWQILEKYEDGTALVISDKILDAKAYNDSETSVTWGTSTLRTWLNDDFYSEAFSENDKAAIIETDVINEDNPEFETDGGENTKDNVFLLSLDEIKDTDYGFDESWNTFDQGRTAKITAYAKGIRTKEYTDVSLWWWLRSPGKSTEYVTYVAQGHVNINGYDVDDVRIGIRPALKINLASPYVKAGEKVIISVKGSEWDTVTFGKYDGKDICWRVLNVSGDNAFLVSDKILNKYAFNSILSEAYWKDSTIRQWLNKDFLNGSFSDVEKEMIITSVINNSYNDYYGVEEGEDTVDKIFLLSLDEISQPGYGFSDQYRVYSEARVAKSFNGEAGWWWLRNSYINVNESGVANDGKDVVDVRGGIRPALHINLKASAWTKGEKVIAGDPSGGIEEPAPTNPPTIAPTTSPTATSTPTATPTPTVTPDDKPTSEPTSTTTPTTQPTVAVTPTTAPSPAVSKDKVTTFSIRNKAKVKKTAKIKVKDKDKIKKITLNGKTVKIKKNKTSVTIKLKSYKKALKKKGKWNTLKVTDNKGNVKTIKFKIK